MNYNVGYVKEYFFEKGFGFIQQGLSKKNYKDLFFHISKIKCKYPEIAQLLDSGKSLDKLLWYSTEKNEKGVCVDEFWLSFEEIPTETQLVIKEQLLNMCVGSISWYFSDETPSLSDLAQIILSKSEYEDLLRGRDVQQQTNCVDELTILPNETQEEKEAKRVWVGTCGLPEEIFKKIFYVGDPYRTNPLSLQPGGSDVIVEYTNGRVCLYNRIKNPPTYIWTFFSGNVERAEDEVLRIFCHTPTHDEDTEEIAFEEVWNSETYLTPWDALKIFVDKKLASDTEEDDFDDFRPDWSVDRSQFDNDWDYAEAVWGIPDPRLVED